MNPGNDTITFVSITKGSTRSERGIKTPSESKRDVPGCSLQPFGVKDQVADTVFTSATHRCISPTTDVTLACKAEDRLEFNGVNYHVVGKKVWTDFRGRVDHITVIVKGENG
jgi:hypothetical protein